MHSWK
jgi:hypothetical protein